MRYKHRGRLRRCVLFVSMIVAAAGSTSPAQSSEGTTGQQLQAMLMATDGLSPESGPPGTVVTVRGARLGPVSEVRFGPRVLDAEIINSATLQFSVPMDAPCGRSELQIRNVGPPEVLSAVMTFTVSRPCSEGESSRLPELPPVPPDEMPIFDVTSLDMPDAVDVGTAVLIAGGIANMGKASCIARVQVRVDGVVFDEGFVPLSLNNAIRIATNPYTFTTTGLHTVELRTQHDSMERKVLVTAEAPQPSDLRRYDLNRDGLIDDSEVLIVIDAWISGHVEDATLLEGIDVWIAQSAVSATQASQARRMEPLTVTAHQAQEGIILSARGSDISSIAAHIYDLNGKRLFSDEAAGTRLTWSFLDRNGRPVPNGSYLYRTIVHRGDGWPHRGSVRKLIVLR